MRQYRETHYWVMPDGRVLSYRTGQYMRPAVVRGYLQLVLTHNKERRNAYVHRMVAEEYIPNPDNKGDVNHKNGVKTDNRVDNLEWCTRRENIAHARETGLIDFNGECGNNSKLTDEQVREIRSDSRLQREIAEDYGITQSQVSRLKSRKQWNHI